MLKLFLSLIFLSSFSVKAEVVMNGKNVFIGDVGRVTDLRSPKQIQLLRTEATPKKVTLNYTVQVPELICTDYEYRTYPCGCVGGWWGGPGRPMPPHRGPGGPGWGGGWGCGPSVCTERICRQTEVVYVPRTRKAKLSFKKSTMDHNGNEAFALNFFLSGRNNYDFNLEVPTYYTVKKRFGRFVISN